MIDPDRLAYWAKRLVDSGITMEQLEVVKAMVLEWAEEDARRGA